MESTSEMETALQFYEAARDNLSLVRVYCYCGNLEKVRSSYENKIAFPTTLERSNVLHCFLYPVAPPDFSLRYLSCVMLRARHFALLSFRARYFY